MTRRVAPGGRTLSEAILCGTSLLKSLRVLTLILAAKPAQCGPPGPTKGRRDGPGGESGGPQEEDEDGEEPSRSRAGVSQRDARWKREREH